MVCLLHLYYRSFQSAFWMKREKRSREKTTLIENDLFSSQKAWTGNFPFLSLASTVEPFLRFSCEMDFFILTTPDWILDVTCDAAFCLRSRQYSHDLLQPLSGWLIFVLNRGIAVYKLRAMESSSHSGQSGQETASGLGPKLTMPVQSLKLKEELKAVVLGFKVESLSRSAHES